MLIPFLAFALLVGTGVSRIEAAIHIYKVTFVGKALFFPKLVPIGNGIKHSGYLIYNTANPANSQTIEVFKNRTFQLNGQMLQAMFPSQIGIGAIDRDGNGINETASALIGFQSGGSTHARAYIGTVPAAGFRVNGVTFPGIARSLKGVGAVTSAGVDNFAVQDSWRFDPLSALQGVVGSNNTNDGVAAVQVHLQSRGYVQVP
jgi:hypothetical protein